MPKVIKPYLGKVVDDKRFKHTMALFLNPKTNYEDGVIRCIMDRTLDASKKNNVDLSELYRVKKIKGLERYEITQLLKINKQEEIIDKLLIKNLRFLGLEDPDIIIDPETNRLHLYFSIPIVNKLLGNFRIYIGHAQGEDLDSLEMTMPVISFFNDSNFAAKEISFAPVNKSGYRQNLFESRDIVGGKYYSTVMSVRVKNLAAGWEVGKTILHPKELNYSWCSGHVSPGPLLPRSFIDVGEGRMVGILNGRGKNKLKKYGIFSVGLFIYDYENGKVDWVSKKPLLIDPVAQNITFASQFIQTKKNEGVLYTHVDDSFVRANTLYADKLKNYI